MVVGRELREKLRSRTFLVTNVALLVLVLAAVAAALLPDGRVASLAEPAGSLQALLEGARRLASLDGALAEAGVSPDRRSSLPAPTPLEVELLGEQAATATGEDVLFVGLAIFVLYAMLIFYGQQVAQGLVKEKQSRVIAVLLSAVRPIDLLGGKLLGLGLLGLGQIVALGATALVALQVTGRGAVLEASAPTVVAGAAWFLLGYALYATVFALTAAVVSRIEDLQTAMIAPVALLMGSLFVAQQSLADPDGTLASVAAILPPVAPILQPLTFARGTASVTSTVVAAFGVVATTAVLVPLAARVHAGASLALRGRISVRDALRRASG